MAFGTSDFGFSKPASSSSKKKKKRSKPKPKPRPKSKRQKTPWWAQGGGGLLGASSPWGGGKAKSASAWDRERRAADKRAADADERAANKKKYAGVHSRMTGMSVIPESYTRAQMKKDIEAAKRKARKNNPKKGRKVTPTSSGGGGGSSSSGGASTGSTTGTDSKYNKPVEQVELDWEKMYAPARKQIANMRAEVERRRKVDEDNWTAYKTWAEGMATKTSDALKANNKATNEAVTANNAAAIESINKYVDQARASMGSSGSLGTATGAGSMSADAAAAAASAGVDGQMIGDAQTSYNTMADAVNAQNQYNVSMAKQAYDQTHNQALFDIDTKSSEIDQAIAAAKLDKFYKDRQYNLDLEAAEWLRGYKDRSLNASIDQANQSAALTRLGLDVKNANTQQAADQAALETRAKAGNDIRKEMASKNFDQMSPHDQGQMMIDVAQNIIAKYPTMSGAAIVTLFAEAFRGRFTDQVSAMQDLDDLLKSQKMGSPGPKWWQDKYNKQFTPRS